MTTYDATRREILALLDRICPPGSAEGETIHLLRRAAGALQAADRAFHDHEAELANVRATLRDEFAMAALPAMIDVAVRDGNDGDPQRECARDAYDYADAMLAERKVRT